jgi:hypothetical protein
MNAIKIRKSVRNFKTEPLCEEDISEINLYLANPQNLVGPFGNEIKLKLLLDSELNKKEKIGTYGVIRNAQGYILGSCADTQQAIFDYGYVLEGLILMLAGMDIGTCWLAGTFDRAEIQKHYQTEQNEIIPAITPLGYPKQSIHFRERVMRTVIKADQRKPADELFFYGDFKIPFNDRSKRYIKPLKYVRMAPSAKNNQPWRIIISSDLKNAHFYIKKLPGSEKGLACAPEYIDIGIAYRHFAIGMEKKGKLGEFLVDDPQIEIPQNMEYIASWKKVKKAVLEE